MNMDRLRLWWTTLQLRERWLIGGGSALVVVVAVYVLLLSPLYAAVDSRAERVARKQADVLWLRSVSAQAASMAATAAANGAGGDESMVVLIDRTARECGLSQSLAGQTPSGEHSIRIRLEAAEFDKLVVCLGAWQQRHAIAVESANIDRTAKGGLVNANLVLTRTGV